MLPKWTAGKLMIPWEDGRVLIGSLITKGFQHQLWQGYGCRLASKWFKAHMCGDSLDLACIKNRIDPVNEFIFGFAGRQIPGIIKTL
jgi:hypothetical protein